MAHRIVRAGAALAIAAVLMLPTPAFADSSPDHASPSADPHAGHDQHDRDRGGTAHEQGVEPEDHSDHAPETAGQSHDHGATTDEDAGHTDHGTQPDEVSPEVRNLVLSGFAGVNAALVFGAWMVRRTSPDPDPRKRTPKASR